MEESKKIRVVMVRPGEIAEIIEIGTGLENLQAAVDGMIEPYYGLDDSDYCIVCNDEGKLLGMEPNRAIRDENGTIQEIICGPFFICDCSGGEFSSLSEEKAAYYQQKFRLPERIFRFGNRFAAIPYEPTPARVREPEGR